MCGICGIISTHNITEQDIRSMCKTMTHRGPDDEGAQVLHSRDKRTNVGLGHRRLSIIDLSPAGHQPMSDATGTIRIVFNGEIYNFPILRAELEQDGVRFNGHCDTEVLIYLYKKYGTEMLQKLRGMFAFALWDAEKEILFAARDRVGVKPFYYTQQNGSFVFGSELKAVLAAPNVQKKISQKALAAYLSYLYVPAPLSIFEDICKLEPGHFLIWENGTTRIKKYWDISFSKGQYAGTEEQVLDRLQQHLEAASSLRTISDVPLGAFLSGGIDSTLVVAALSATSNTKIKTFSIGFEEKEYSELQYARIAAEHFSTEHHEEIVTPKAMEVLPEIVFGYDEPFGDSSAVPSYYVSKMARKHITVAISGDGGDEAFVGYGRYFGAAQDAWLDLPAPLTNKIKGLLAGRTFKGKARLMQLLSGKYERYIDKMSYFKTWELPFLMKDSTSAAELPGSFLQYLQKDLPYISALQALDYKTYLPDEMLVKVDRASMMNSLEVRSPFLDHTLIEYAASLPLSMKIRNNESKYLLKKLLLRYIPDKSFVYRKKMGFSVPIDTWIRNDIAAYVGSTLLSPQAKIAEHLDQGYIERLIAENNAGILDHTTRLWQLIILEEWMKKWL